MTKAEVLTLLEENRNERGIQNWQKLEAASKLDSFGIGLTQLRKLAKQVGRDHKLAQQLWNSKVYDAKVVGLLIDEPAKLTREQVERQVDELNGGMLAHVFASCDATLAKAPFAREVADAWMDSEDDTRRRCGFLLLYELSKDKKDATLDDAYFADRIECIRDAIHEEENWVKDAMNVALMGIGKRNKKLNRAALKAAKAIGTVDIDYGDNGCEPLDVVKHLTSDYLKKKLGS